MPARLPLIVLGAAMIALGAFLPEAWYQPLDPLAGGTSVGGASVAGWTLLRVVLAIEGVVVLVLAVLNVRYHAVPPGGRLNGEEQGGRAPGWVAVGIAAIIMLGAGLRLVGIDTDLWLDEIVSTRRYGSATFWQIYTTYNTTNNHLLNSWLVRLMVALFGYQEWAIRLPAVLFGILTIPAMYCVARLISGHASSLAAALMVAVSYHHIFFSQNARGYSAYALFGLLAALLLVRAMANDRRQDWAMLVLVNVLAVAAHPTGVFLVVGQAVAGSVGVALIGARAGAMNAALPMGRRLFAAFAVTGAMLLILYAPAIPQAIVVAGAVYTTASSGFQPLSFEFLQQLLLGFTPGLRALLLAAAPPAALVGAIGFASLVRRNPVVLLALTAGSVVHLALVILGGLTFSPRFLLVLLFPFVLITLEVAHLAADQIGRRMGSGRRARMGAVMMATAAVCALFMLPLPAYYSMPKQSYTAPLDYVVAEHRDAALIAVHLAESGVAYYGEEHPRETVSFERGANLFYVRSVEALDAALLAAESRQRPIVMLTTLERYLELEVPDLAARLRADYVVERVFPGSIGDGAVKVWRSSVDARAR